jgi:hypothetical protein
MMELAQITKRLASGDFDMTELPDGSAVILDMAGHRVLTLSSTATVIVSMLRQSVTDVGAITRCIVSEFEVEPAVAEADIRRFLDALAAALERAETRS